MVTTESLAARATMSAQETTPGHSFSTRALMPSMKPKPRTLRFGGETFSVWLALAVFVELSKTEPSHP